MPRPILFDTISAGQTAEQIDMELKTKEHWYKHNKNMIWANNLGPIQGRIMTICNDKNELSRKLMDSKDEYFKYCKPRPQPQCANNQLVIQIGPDPCDECFMDPTVSMRTPCPEQRAILFEGLSHEGGGAYGYLQNRYDCGLPETKFCFPPTTNSEYGWKLLANVQNSNISDFPRKSTIGPAFFRSRGVLCEADFAPYHFPN